MIHTATYLTYLAACFLVIVVPGPNVTVIIANSLRHGTRAGLASVAGTQAGLAVVLCVLAHGLETIVAHLASVFDIVRLVGAAYLVWLGITLWRANGQLIGSGTADRGRRGFFLQGFLVLLSNPKVFLFFGAFIPQFINPAGDTVRQTLLLGGTFMAVAILLDGAYALAAGRAGGLLERRNVRLLERASGTCLIGGGVWLALIRRA